MATGSDRRPSGLVLVFCLLLAAALVTPLGAQEASPSPGQLSGRLQERFQVLALDDGVALVPRRAISGVRVIELKGSSILVNGARVSPEVLRAWLDDDALPILELSSLDTRARRRALGLPPIVELPPQHGEAPLQAPPPPATRSPAAEPEPRAELEAAAPAPVDPPPKVRRRQGPGVDSEVRLKIGRNLEIGEDEVAEDVVVIGGELEIAGDVLGDALAVGGPVTVSGRVSGDLSAVGGVVRLEDEAEVYGKVVVVGGRLERDPGAKVFGEVTEVDLGSGNLQFGPWSEVDLDEHGWRPRWHWASPFRAMSNFSGELALTILLALFVLLARALFTRPTELAEALVEREPWKAALVGLLAIVGFWLVLVPVLVIVLLVLTLTIIGIPVAALVFLASIVLAIAVPLVGYTAVAGRVGSFLGGRFAWARGGTVWRLLVGVAVIEIWLLLVSLLPDASCWTFLPLVPLLLVGVFVEFAAWTVGLGAILLSLRSEGPVARYLGGTPRPPVPPPPPEPSPEAQLPPESELEAQFEAELAAQKAQEADVDGEKSPGANDERS